MKKVTLSERSESNGYSPGEVKYWWFLVAEAFCFHIRAVEFCKSDFTAFVFFGTLCTRPATKSEISARASTREVYKLYK